MKRPRILAIRLLVAVACSIASAMLGSTSAAADDGPDLAAIGRYVGLPLLVSWTWVLVVLVGLPRVIRAPLPAMLMGLPDLAYPLLASAVLAFGWGLARAVWAIRTLSTPPTPVSTPSTRATTQLSMTNS